jgi:hypothetical protein
MKERRRLFSILFFRALCSARGKGKAGTYLFFLKMLFV